MRITQFSVKNPQFTLVAFLLVAALGVFSFLNIPRAEDPYFPTPNYGITAIYPGAGPEEVEREVADLGRSEVAAVEIGERVLPRLRMLDEVSYVRFASIYRDFRDIDEFAKELGEVVKARK